MNVEHPGNRESECKGEDKIHLQCTGEWKRLEEKERRANEEEESVVSVLLHGKMHWANELWMNECMVKLTTVRGFLTSYLALVSSLNSRRRWMRQSRLHLKCSKSIAHKWMERNDTLSSLRSSLGVFSLLISFLSHWCNWKCNNARY